MRGLQERLTIVVPIAILLVGIGCVEAGWPDWECDGTPNPVYPDWHYNHETKYFAHSTGVAWIKGDHESADFRCVCHREGSNPDDGWDATAICYYYGPLWYWYAHTYVVYYENGDPVGDSDVWIYTD